MGPSYHFMCYVAEVYTHKHQPLSKYWLLEKPEGREKQDGKQDSHTKENVCEPVSLLWNALILGSLSGRNKSQAQHGDTHASYK